MPSSSSSSFYLIFFSKAFVVIPLLSGDAAAAAAILADINCRCQTLPSLYIYLIFMSTSVCLTTIVFSVKKTVRCSFFRGRKFRRVLTSGSSVTRGKNTYYNEIGSLVYYNNCSFFYRGRFLYNSRTKMRISFSASDDQRPENWNSYLNKTQCREWFPYLFFFRPSVSSNQTFYCVPSGKEEYEVIKCWKE